MGTQWRESRVAAGALGAVVDWERELRERRCLRARALWGLGTFYCVLRTRFSIWLSKLASQCKGIQLHIGGLERLHG